MRLGSPWTSTSDPPWITRSPSSTSKLVPKLSAIRFLLLARELRPPGGRQRPIERPYLAARLAGCRIEHHGLGSDLELCRRPGGNRCDGGAWHVGLGRRCPGTARDWCR